MTASQTPTALRLAIESPIGPLLLGASASGHMTELAFADSPHRADRREASGAVSPARAVLDRAATQLEEYFAGRRRAFALPLAPRGTPFQRRVWDAVVAIAYGTTATYGGLAAVIDRPRAARAVGHANGHNPIAVVIPCHRVLGTSGSLTGYGGGIEAKAFLLALERSER
jgi:methylated-DNA-[protein]-cysteine S-methyltransferase